MHLDEMNELKEILSGKEQCRVCRVWIIKEQVVQNVDHFCKNCFDSFAKWMTKNGRLVQEHGSKAASDKWLEEHCKKES